MAKFPPLRYGPDGGNPNRIRVYKEREISAATSLPEWLIASLFGKPIQRHSLLWRWTCPCLGEWPNEESRPAESFEQAFAMAIAHARKHAIEHLLSRLRW